MHSLIIHRETHIKVINAKPLYTKYILNIDMNKVTLKIFGMTCEDCVYTVKSNLEKAGAKEVNVSLENGTATLFIDSEKLSPQDLVKLPIFSKDSPYKAQVRKVE